MFFCRQGKMFSVFNNLCPCKIDPAPRKLHYRVFLPVTAPQHDTDTQQQLFRQEWFDHIVVGSESQSSDPVLILPLRTFDWALQSPAAQILIYSYAAFMIFSGIFSVLAYTAGNVKNKWMQLCMVINCIYAVGAVGIVGMIVYGMF